MRVEGFSSAPLNRISPPGSAVTPYRDVRRDDEQRGEQPAAPSASQGLDQQPLPRRVQASSAGSENLPARPQDLYQAFPVSSRAAQALASYGSTASLPVDPDAAQILGLDLYA
jgi:hypothetical protein